MSLPQPSRPPGPPASRLVAVWVPDWPGALPLTVYSRVGTSWELSR